MENPLDIIIREAAEEYRLTLDKNARSLVHAQFRQD